MSDLRGDWEAWRSVKNAMQPGEWEAFLAGSCHARTGVDGRIVFSFIRQVSRERDKGRLQEVDVNRIEESVYWGELGIAHEILIKTGQSERVPHDDLKLAHAIQDEFDHELQSMREHEVALTCQKCNDPIQPPDTAVLECTHIFHRLCIRQIVEEQLSIGDVSLECAVCMQPLKREDLALAFAKGEVDQIERKTKKKDDVVMYCPSLGCKFKGKWTVEQFFFCTECEKYYCLICCSELPPNESSKYHLCRGATAEDEMTYKKLCSGLEIKQCPDCHYWNEVATHVLSCMCGKKCCVLCGEQPKDCRCDCRKPYVGAVNWIFSKIRG